MLKRTSIIKFILITIIAILGILLCVCPFSVPQSTDIYNGIIPSINKGVDINGGISAIFECSNPNDSEKGLTQSIDDSLAKIKSALEYEQFAELQVSRQGGNKVYIVASGEYATQFNTSFSYIADGRELSFTVVSVSDSNPNPRSFSLSNEVAKSYVDVDYNAKAYGVRIEFTNAGVEKLQELKTYAKSLSKDSVYLYLGDLVSSNSLAEVDIDDLGEKSIFISLNSSYTTKSSSSTSSAREREVAYYIIGGALNVDLELREISSISPIFGKNTQLYLSIALAIIFVGVIACLIARYRHLGLLAGLALTFYAILFSFFLMALPFIILNISGVIGSVCAFLVAVLAMIFLFEKIKDEYAIGKKIHLSCKGGFKRALWPILDSHIIIIFISIFMWIFSPAMLKCFAIALILGALLSAFTSLVIMRGFIKNYLRINSSRAKKLGLYRDKNVKEIKDEQVQIIKDDMATSIEGGSHE